MNAEHLRNSGVLLCGGRGERLQEITNGTPKSLFVVGKKPLISYSIESLPTSTSDFIFAVDHKASDLVEWVQKQKFTQSVHFSYQESPGVVEAVKNGVGNSPYDEGNIVCNTDEIRIGLEVARILDFHRKSKRPVTLVGTYSDNLYRHGLMTIGNDGIVTTFRLKPSEYIKHPEKVGIVFTGLMVMNKRATEEFDPEHDPNWMGILDPLLNSHQLAAYVVPNIKFFNVGTKEEYFEAEKYLSETTQT